MQNDDDVICIAFKRLPEGGYVALDSDNKPIKAFTSYHELEVDTIMGMRRVCGGHPADVPKFIGAEHQQPLRDEFPTQPVKSAEAIPFRQRVAGMVSRATRP